MTHVEGIVTYTTVESGLHPHTTQINRNAVRVRMRQHGRGTPMIEVLVDTGPGTDGLHRAQAMRRRLKPGTPATAIGEALIVHQDYLILRRCERVLGGEAHALHEPQTEAA